MRQNIVNLDFFLLKLQLFLNCLKPNSFFIFFFKIEKGFYRKDHLRKHTRSHIARRVKSEVTGQTQPTSTTTPNGSTTANGRQAQNASS